MNDVELDIYKANANQQLNQAVRTADGELFKSWATDLSKKFPNGGWRTINGAHVFVDGGKVVAGLDGFNGKVDDAFKESGKSESKGGKKEISIGTKYESLRGEPMKVVGLVNTKLGEMYQVVNENEDKPTKELFSKDDLTEEMEFAEKNRKEFIDSRESTEKKQIERDQSEKEKSSEYNDLDGFGKDLSPMQLGKYKKELNKVNKTKGYGSIKDKDYTKLLLKDGFKVTHNEDTGKDELTHPDKSWGISSKHMVEFAKHLQPMPPYHKDDKLNEFRDMAKESKSESDFVSKIRAKRDVTPDVSGEFHEKYNPKGNLSPEKAAGALFKEVHNTADVDVTGNKPEKLPQSEPETKPKESNSKFLTSREAKSKFKGKEINGFAWTGHDKGINSFQKKETEGKHKGKYSLIEVSDEQMSNGDIEFMTENGMTLGKDRIKEAKDAWGKHMDKN